MNRRGFLKSAAGVLVAAGAGELLLPERRVWALGSWEKERPFRPEDLAQAMDAWAGWGIEDFARDPVAYFTWLSEQRTAVQKYEMSYGLSLYPALGIILNGEAR